MDPIVLLAVTVIAALGVGGGVGFLIQGFVNRKRMQAAQTEAAQVLKVAEERQKQLLLETKEEMVKLRSNLEAENRERRADLHRQERRLAQKEENLDRRLEGLERRDHNLANKERELESSKSQIESLRKKQAEQLEAISKMTTAEAKELLLKNLETELDRDFAKRIYEREQKLQEEANEKARKVIILAIQRVATDVVSENTISVVPLPNDEMKGRLIGREGRNIRALEAATGVELIIDDTPEAVTLSSFDPIRREVARIALNNLILDGRIHPARVEEIVEKAKAEVEGAVQKAGEEALYETGIAGLHPELVELVGQLKYRYSYGHNVLRHSIEVSLLAGIMAAELGADQQIVKLAGLLHDVGKAMTHEVEGPHAHIGGDIARKYGIPEAVIRGIEEHHADEGRVSTEGFLVAAADAISGARPGARRDSLEHYVKRLEALEEVANGFPGVEKSYAIQAGREVRIMVKPGEVDDIAASKLARDVAKKIEETLVYPGQIKVIVVRESRSVEYAR